MAKHRTGHLFKRGETFYVRWAVAGKVFSKALHNHEGKAITNRREAENARAELMAPFTVGDEAAALETVAAKLEGRKAELARLEDQQNPPLAIDSAWGEYLISANRPDTGNDTLGVYQGQWSMFANWVREKHPDLTAMRDVTRGIAEEYATTLNGGSRSANTYNKHLNLLTLVYRVLKNKAKVPENPWQDIPRKRVVSQGRRELTVDELRKVCQGATGELRTLLALGVYTGLRLGDAATLRWAEVDLPRDIIRRIPNKTARRNPNPVIVPVHPVLREMLAETPAESRGEYVLPQTAALYLKNRWALIKSIQGHFTDCGIKVHKAAGAGTKDRKLAVVEVGFHSLRHTFVSLCRESDAPLAVVESIVGHSNPAMTRHYTHVGEVAAGRAVAALPSVFADTKAALIVRTDQRGNALLSQITAIIEGMDANNWVSSKSKLLQLVQDESALG